VAVSTIAGVRLKNPAHPGGFVKSEIIEPLGLSVTATAQVLGVTAMTTSPHQATQLKQSGQYIRSMNSINDYNSFDQLQTNENEAYFDKSLSQILGI
jgi:hypothetical protein